MVQQRLLDIAIAAFGEHGFDGTSTRDIAKAAGTAMSSITYHFGGKDGLYLAAAGRIAEQMIDLLSTEPVDVIVANRDRAGAREALKTAVRGFVTVLQDKRFDGWSLFIMREQLAPTQAFERLYESPMGAILNDMVELVCVAARLEDRVTARLATLSLFAQALILKSAPATCRKLLGQDALTPEILSAYEHRLIVNLDAILDALTQA